MVSHFILISTHMPPPQCLLLTPFLTLSLFLITQSKLSFLSPLIKALNLQCASHYISSDSLKGPSTPPPLGQRMVASFIAESPDFKTRP